ncbi:MAG TPA: aldehyde dehydrogenase family protein [Rhizomicrobium sp.]|nr:aldehyde dehydrogenase family protein [Rhizomicrobium sp.]
MASATAPCWKPPCWKAWDRLDVGGVVIGDVPSYRVDNMPYGGVKDSGLGRESVRFAMDDMTEIRNLVIRTPSGA